MNSLHMGKNFLEKKQILTYTATSNTVTAQTSNCQDVCGRAALLLLLLWMLVLLLWMLVVLLWMLVLLLWMLVLLLWMLVVLLLSLPPLLLRSSLDQLRRWMEGKKGQCTPSVPVQGPCPIVLPAAVSEHGWRSGLTLPSCLSACQRRQSPQSLPRPLHRADLRV